MNFTNEDLRKIKEKVEIEIIRAGEFFYNGRILDSQIRIKGKNDFVTDVDVNIQEFLMEKLKIICPQAAIISEEKDNEEVDLNGLVWILDPCDGTTNLIHGYKHSSISLALSYNLNLLFGMVYDPYTKEIFWAIKGQGAFLNDERIEVSKVGQLSDALVAFGTGGARIGRGEETFQMIYDLFKKSQSIRRIGSAALEICYFAGGRTDAYLEEDLKIWDYAAGLLISKEAGGCVRDFHGEDLSLKMRNSIICANPNLIEKLNIYCY